MVRTGSSVSCARLSVALRECGILQTDFFGPSRKNTAKTGGGVLRGKFRFCGFRKTGFYEGKIFEYERFTPIYKSFCRFLVPKFFAPKFAQICYGPDVPLMYVKNDLF